MSRPVLPAVWSRPRYRASGIEASCTFFLFWADEGHEATAGLYAAFAPYEGAPPASVALEHIRWVDEEALGFVNELRSRGSLRGLDEAVEKRISASPRVESIAVTAREPSDLGYLQATWALVANAVDQGAIAVKDVDAERWWTADEIRALDPHRPFVPEREISVDIDRVDSWIRYQTRGMLKLGLADLGLGVPATDEQSALGRYFLGRAIQLGADGEPFATGDELVEEGLRIQVIRAFERPNQQPLHILELLQRA